MERNCGWQEKELEMLYAMVAQQASSSTTHLLDYKPYLGARRTAANLQKQHTVAQFTRPSILKPDVVHFLLFFVFFFCSVSIDAKFNLMAAFDFTTFLWKML